MRIYALSCLFALSVFTLVYWDYPFDGMIVEESWIMYTNPANLSGIDTVLQKDDLWSRLFTRRGLWHLTLLVIREVNTGPLFVNALGITVQVVNLILFAFIVRKLAGPARLFPILTVSLLYPFASGARFWQVLLVHHLAVMFFLVALALFLCINWSRGYRVRDLMFYGLPSVGCFWLSLGLMEHAVLMPLLFVYLALYNTNSQSALLRFKKFWSPSIGFALCYLLVSVAVIVLFIHEGHPRLNFLSPLHAARFRELASLAHIPPAIVAGLVVGVNAVLFYTSAMIANSIGYLAYPLIDVIEHFSPLVTESQYLAVGVSLVTLLGSYGLYVLRSGRDHVFGPEVGQAGFLLTLGLLWTFLAYFPFSTSFAYPRIVGQSADRINMLALFGVSLCLGLAVDRFTATTMRSSSVRVAAFFTGSFLAISILLLNLYIQREYWIEGYLKERQLVVAVLDSLGQEQLSGRRPIVLLDRQQKAEPVRYRLNKALHEPSAVGKMLKVARIVLERHFTEAGEIEVTGFHLRGVPLFGGAADGATYVFNNYARLFSMNPVPVYKMEQGFSLKRDTDKILVGYDHIGWTAYSEREYEPVVLVLDESFFQLRGAVTYRVQPYVWLDER